MSRTSPRRSAAAPRLLPLLFSLSGLVACAGDVTPGSVDSALDPNEGSAEADGEDQPGNTEESPDEQGPPGDGETDEPSGDGASGDGDVSAPDDGERPGFRLVWRDEFEGAAGTTPDASRWAADVGGDGWGNNQLEYDTNRPENVSLDGQGSLAIKAVRESYMGREYTSARIKTQGLFEHAYGRFEARMKLPAGQGIWPAFWLLGNDIGGVGWPTCGEIDIMENIGRAGETARTYGTIHGPGYSGEAGIGQSHDLSSGEFKDGFHVFAIEWEENELRWYLDDVLFQTRTPADLPEGADWVYDHPFFIILNLAVGGYWPGNPDQTTQFPQTLSIDYVRVYEKAP